ncbi:hypothetical protein ZIOFF_073360 [Zingiber officinale]|uniref:Protein NLRC3 n=1 Tax=Zingiber officinale TaxID=94328 RepID=A0A8J5C706_ZINOF|nr:hypothetical protein ZIOFF_073360 [Zingiber officinale]
METHALAASYSLRSGVHPSSSVPLPSTHGLPCKQRHRVEIASFAVPAGALLAVSFGENSSKWKLNHTNACGFKTLFLFSSSGQNLGLQVELDVANNVHLIMFYLPLGSSLSQMYMNAYSVMPKFDCLDGTANLLLQHIVLWKVAGKLIMPKPKGSTFEIKKAPSSRLKWSFSPRTNLLSGGAAKLEKESRQKLNEFSKELRTFRSVDLSGRNFGDDGLFFLAESLGYNRLLKAAEEVDFSGNGITAVGLKALDGVLQKNTMLKTLNLSGNNIGDEGAKCLSDILKVNGCIQKLQLNSSGIGDEGARVIADILKENQTLRVLELNNNMIEYSGFARKITLLDIGNNEIGPKGAFNIAEFVKKTKSLLWLNLYMNDIGDEVWLLTIVALCSVASLLKHKLSSKFTNLKYSRVEIDEVRFE